MKKLISVTTIFLFTAIHCFCHSNPDTIAIPRGYLDHVDTIKLQQVSLFANPNLPISDSTYIKRLLALPFAFKMTYNPVVKRYIELYTVKIKSKLQVIMGLSDFYFPIFNTVLEAYQLPNELKYIPIIESALNPRAVSRARAVGLWQFIKSTGKENGLTINNYVDERRGLIESTKSAAKYLTRLYAIYHDWTLVLAAYNCGPGNVNKAIRRSGGKRDFWEIYKFLPRETRGYVPEYIGAAYAFNYYKEHNIIPVPATFPLQMDTITIFKNLHLRQVAEVLGLQMDVLRMINPQYLRDIIPANEKTTYFLNVPFGQKEKFMELKDSIYAYQSPLYQSEFRKHTYLSPSATTANLKKVVHHVRSGECISGIAGHYNVSIHNLKGWNSISGTAIKQGQRLIVYVPRKENYQ
jgi:membrane-bound lytic murein transglycosylase D